MIAHIKQLTLKATLAFTSIFALSALELEAKPTPVLKGAKAQVAQPKLAPAGVTAVKAAVADGRVDINSASAAELTKLKGIGAKRAEAIVKDREVNGPYASPMDLTRVKGIGKRTVEKNMDQIKVVAPPAQPVMETQPKVKK
jgi:competence protein ComEA